MKLTIYIYAVVWAHSTSKKPEILTSIRKLYNDTDTFLKFTLMERRTVNARTSHADIKHAFDKEA